MLPIFPAFSRISGKKSPFSPCGVVTIMLQYSVCAYYMKKGVLMEKQKRKPLGSIKALRVALLLAADIVLINLSQFLALLLRYEFNLNTMLESGYLESLVEFAPVHTLIVIAMLGVFGIYKSLWEYVGVKEAGYIALSAAMSSILQYFLMSMLQMPMPRSFPLLSSLLLTVFIAGERLAYRLLRSLQRGMMRYDQQQPTMLIGAGAAGAMVLRDLQGSEMSRNRIVCVIDDDEGKRGRSLLGVPIVGGREAIEDAVRSKGVREIILAIPTATGSQRRAILEICQRTGCTTKILPGIAELASGDALGRQLRQVEIADLLGRDSIEVDMHSITGHIRHRRVLVTGGGGSIGSELCRQVAACSPSVLIIYDIYENNAYAIEQELRRRYPSLNLVTLIGSVRDKAKVEQVFRDYRPEIVYHAAAHKHVPLMETSPAEAVKNNVFGTKNVAEAADAFGAKAFVLISTDKAVNPTSIMGTTKRVCEMIIQAMDRRSEHTRYVAVRFGNVLGSNGSVIPLFREQIEHGGPVTVTHREMVRYFMTIPEAVSLVMQAGVYAKGGEIFVLDMGSPVKIDDLARNMIRLCGLEPDVDIPIVYTGLRPGEKLYEELLLAEEGLEKTANDLIFVGHPNGFSDEGLAQSLSRLESLCRENDANGVVKELAGLVKTYNPHPEMPRKDAVHG